MRYYRLGALGSRVWHGDVHAGSVPRINTQGAEKEAGLGRRRSMIGCDAISTKSPMGSTGAKMAVHSFQNWNEGDGPL